MRKRTVVLLVCLAALLAVPPASAAPKDQCNGQGVLAPAAGSDADANDDGFVCIRPGGRTKDNNERAEEPLPAGRQCPEGSYAYPGNNDSTFDTNGNGRVCVNPETGAIEEDDPSGEPTPGPMGPGLTNCPPGFETVFAFFYNRGPEADINQNGVICREPNSNTFTDDFD
jgi:hypothetical protein